MVPDFFFYSRAAASHLLFLLISVLLSATAPPSAVTAVCFVIVPCWLRPGHPGQSWEQNLVLWLATCCLVPETSIFFEVVKIYLRGDSSIKLWSVSSSLNSHVIPEGRDSEASPPAPQSRACALLLSFDLTQEVVLSVA